MPVERSQRFGVVFAAFLAGRFRSYAVQGSQVEDKLLFVNFVNHEAEWAHHLRTNKTKPSVNNDVLQIN